MKAGIVGLPNAGKSTLFNALTSAAAETGEYPFTTVDPNVAVSPVPDARLAAIAETVGSSELVPAMIEFNDIAGLVRGASEGEGLGNRFLAAIRETDVICHVVRCHTDPRVAHPEGRVDPVADIETVETELLLADLEQAERRLERVTKLARSGTKEAIAEQDWLRRVVAALGEGKSVRAVPTPTAAPEGPRQLGSLTAKPVLYVANVDEEDPRVPDAVRDHAATMGARVLAVSARIEAELAELAAAEAAEMRAELGIEESGLERLVREAYELLGLITFFTAHAGVEACARSLGRGRTAYDAAGRVHKEIQQGFVRAEVIGWRELVERGGYAAARERGLLRLEGREYVVQDGDVITIKH